MQVVFNGSLLEDITGPELTHGTFHDTIKIATESASTVQELPIELWLHARPPRPRLGLQGDLQFGVVPLGTKAQKQLQLRNTGTAQAEFSITWDKWVACTAAWDVTRCTQRPVTRVGQEPATRPCHAVHTGPAVLTY